VSATVADGLLPRLLAGGGAGALAALEGHLDVHGPLPRVGGRDLIDVVEAAGLRGRGGGGFPAATKQRAVRSARGRPIVVANGCESEPLSAKDALLLEQAPHLVLDGALAAAHAVGADEVIVALEEPNASARASVERAIGERRGREHEAIGFTVRSIPSRFLSGQDTALVAQLNGGLAKPTFTPPHPSERGVRHRPTLVHNVETLAHLALIARHGPDWFRELGTADESGSTLVTVVGAVSGPGVYEIELGTPLRTLLAAAGGTGGPIAGLLIGGFFGSWLPPQAVGEIDLSNAWLDRYDAALGCGVICVLPAGACPVAETARVAVYLASATARQCGPCVHGSAAIAHTLHAIAVGAPPPNALGDLDRWIAELPGRGACHLPDGLAHFAATALENFGEAFDDHARHGPCGACAHAPVLALPVSGAPVGR
jgi:NADH:ubiquinone oxidoreductase subunit F (NADH-binding)